MKSETNADYKKGYAVAVSFDPRVDSDKYDEANQQWRAGFEQAMRDMENSEPFINVMSGGY
jgi:hypothetical protein